MEKEGNYEGRPGSVGLLLGNKQIGIKSLIALALVDLKQILLERV